MGVINVVTQLGVLWKHTNQLVDESDSACNKCIARLDTNILMTDFSVKRSFLGGFDVYQRMH